MYKVLVIGCGGSGAKTLAYMMDQLRADLAVFGIKEIPGCWQFLNVDTPLQEEEGQAVGSVSKQGGAYVACGVASGEYAVVDQALTERVQQGAPEGLRHLATWMPRHPRDVTFPVTVGAGQFRGIGRLLILSKLREVSHAVEAAMARMSSPESQEQAARVAAVVPGAGTVPDISAPPLVLVVSSMAGGSGASMTLDVCRLVAGANTTPAIDPQLISVFLYTAEAFGSVPAHLRAGMPGNTLAMLGEIVAAQAGAQGTTSRQDQSLYSLLGLSNQAGRAFKRVTPIGLKAGGSGAVFGDGTAEGVFRGMGRGLARYISSPAFRDYVSYDIANMVSVPNRQAVSWGVDPTDMVWSSFGYSSLSTGRDRYAEYASQRIARRAVDHLLDGFKLPGATTGDTQRLADLWRDRASLELNRLALPQPSTSTVLAGSQAVDQATVSWILSEQTSPTVNERTLRERAREVVGSLFSRKMAIQGGITPGDWIQTNERWLLSQEPQVTAELSRTAALMALNLSKELAQRLADNTRLDLAELGIPYALTVLTHLRQSGGVLAALADHLQAIGNADRTRPLAPPQGTMQKVRSLGNGTLGSEGLRGLDNELQAQLSEQVFYWLAAQVSQDLAPVVRDLAASAIKPLENVLNDARKVLEGARADKRSAFGVADVATDLYAAWPEEAPPGQVAAVPQRFATAHNEVVLMGVDTYAATFGVHVKEAAPVGARDETGRAYQAVVQQVVTGEWEQGAGDPSPADLLTVTASWVPQGLPGATQGSLPTPARYELRLRPADLLRRARAFVSRRGESFEAFTSQSLRGFLNDDTVGDHERDQRSQAVQAGLRRALEMARPLVEIDPQVYATLHNGDRPRLAFNFSQVPFRNQPVAGEFLDYLSHSDAFDTDLVVDNFNRSLGDDDVARVDVFGSYPRSLPVAYSGLLKSVAEAWDAATGSAGAREAFWRFRRARPLAGGLPMGDDERRALVRGWWAATLAGGISRDPWSQVNDQHSVRVWDRQEQEWVDFPAPMLTPPSQMIAPNAWLPAVLESSLLAYLRVSREGMAAFRPWAALRRWADDGANGHQERYGSQTPVETMLATLLGQGAVDGLTPVVDLTAATTPAERRTVLLAFVDAVCQDLEASYLPGAGKADEPGRWTNFRRRELVETAPLSVDLAAEMLAELQAVRQSLASVVPAGAAASPISFGGLEY
ncbi:tubulin-like doman-containing protein [Actinomyces weissii]|uniref:Tubulin-like protein n=1 Tax=Actinomyces weissii TaxID=675090 RepID=A0A7T7MA53_9ACTO|nr:tubulin-like doman-containing protein [Actinomyces weissii]QQM67730.1 tubulin-like protein [Actinomyces weissii]